MTQIERSWDGADVANCVLAPVDPRSAFILIIEMLVDVASRDEKFMDALLAFRRYISRPLDSHATDILSRLDLSKFNHLNPGRPALPTIAQAVFYRAALHAIGQPEHFKRAVESLRQPASAISDIKDFINSQPNFIANLAVESVRRASKDPHFAKTVEDASKELTDLTYEASFDAPNFHHVMARMNADPTNDPQGGGGGGGGGAIAGCSIGPKSTKEETLLCLLYMGFVVVLVLVKIFF